MSALFCAAGGVLCLFYCYRNNIVLRIRLTAIDTCYRREKALMECGQFAPECWKPYEEGPSYEQMLRDLRKWHFEQFYPELGRPLPRLRRTREDERTTTPRG